MQLGGTQLVPLHWLLVDNTSKKKGWSMPTYQKGGRNRAIQTPISPTCGADEFLGGGVEWDRIGIPSVATPELTTEIHHWLENPTSGEPPMGGIVGKSNKAYELTQISFPIVAYYHTRGIADIFICFCLCVAFFGFDVEVSQPGGAPSCNFCLSALVVMCQLQPGGPPG